MNSVDEACSWDPDICMKKTELKTSSTSQVTRYQFTPKFIILAVRGLSPAVEQDWWDFHVPDNSKRVDYEQATVEDSLTWENGEHRECCHPSVRVSDWQVPAALDARGLPWRTPVKNGAGLWGKEGIIMELPKITVNTTEFSSGTSLSNGKW